MKLSHILLSALFITSCNDSIKIDPKDNNEKEMKNEITKEEITNINPNTNSNTTPTIPTPTPTPATNNPNTDTNTSTNTNTTDTTTPSTPNTEEEVSDCIKNLRQECVAGKWILKSIKLSEKGIPKNELKLTESQKNQYIEVIGTKVSGRIFLLKEEDLSLTDDPLYFLNTDYSLFKDSGGQKIRFQINQTKIESTIKNIKNNILTLVRSGKIKNKEYEIETLWTKK